MRLFDIIFFRVFHIYYSLPLITPNNKNNLIVRVKYRLLTSKKCECELFKTKYFVGCGVVTLLCVEYIYNEYFYSLRCFWIVQCG